MKKHEIMQVAAL